MLDLGLTVLNGDQARYIRRRDTDGRLASPTAWETAKSVQRFLSRVCTSITRDPLSNWFSRTWPGRTRTTKLLLSICVYLCYMLYCCVQVVPAQLEMRDATRAHDSSPRMNTQECEHRGQVGQCLSGNR